MSKYCKLMQYYYKRWSGAPLAEWLLPNTKGPGFDSGLFHQIYYTYQHVGNKAPSMSGPIDDET